MHLTPNQHQVADNIIFPPYFYLLIVNKLLLFLVSFLQKNED